MLPLSVAQDFDGGSQACKCSRIGRYAVCFKCEAILSARQPFLLTLALALPLGLHLSW